MTAGDLLIGDIFTNAARAVPGRNAVSLGDRSLTFAALDARSNQVARALVSLGIRRAARVALWSDTTIDAVPLFAALAKIGAVFAPVNGLLGEEEVAPILATYRPDLVVTNGRGTPDGAAPSMSRDELGHLADAQPTDDVRDDGLREVDPHAAFFTSGSTGAPRAAVLSHRCNYLRSHPGALPEPRGAMVCPYPLFHMGAWTIALQQWQARDGVVLVTSAQAPEICEAVARHGATRLNCVPSVWQRIIDHVGTSGRDLLATLRFADTGTSATPLELLEAIEGIAPEAHLRVFYGSTEAGSVACLDQRDFGSKPGSCGPPAPGVRIRRDEVGELWVSSPLLFDGYLDDPEATAASLVDSWYRTGDLAEEDGDGFLRIVGRTGDLVRTGGEAVLPGEVESVLAGHPAVLVVAVVGLPDPRWGEVVCAAVVVRPGTPPPSVADLRAWCEGRLAPFKRPRDVRIVGSVPRTASTGQVQRRLLVDRLRPDG
ncbi:MAG: class I adenylate-forming enzyme family protein [Acidimicrobiales bacterium]